MRLLLMAIAAGLVPSLGAQDVPKGDAPVAVPHGKICSGDDAVTARPTLLAGYGSGGFAVATGVSLAQSYFDNGMQLAAAFAHKASIAAMAEAVRLDPACAMCLWGDAWVSGPTINYPVDDKARAIQAEKLVRADALALAHGGTERDRALIAALKLRYDVRMNFGAANLAFAQAMDALADRYPQDKAVATIAADAWLVASFDQKRDALRSQYRAVVLLERVLAHDPDYTPAIHFYIHATEIAKFPARATPYADRLQGLAPKASHLVHMPSHTYYWIGRYQDAADANRRAVALGIENAKRLGMVAPDGVWNLPYHAHNVHFGVGGAMMSGDAATALALSDPLVAAGAKRDTASVFSQAVGAMGYAAEGRYAAPAVVMALPQPKLPYLRAFWHYARGEAQSRVGDAAAVRREGAAIATLLNDRKAMADPMGQRLVRIAGLVLAGRAAMLDNDPRTALRAFERAAAIEEHKVLANYADPPLWWYPVRRSVAEARLAAGDARGAVAEADRSLLRRPNDPITLAVRARAASALGDRAAAGRDARAALAGWRGPRQAFRSTLS